MRWVKRGLLGIGVLLLVGVVVATLQWRARGERLIEDTKRLSADRPRPLHREPAEGLLFEECAAPLIDAPPDRSAYKVGPDFIVMKHEVEVVLEGDASFESLSPTLRADLAGPWPWAREFLRCTQAPATGEVQGVGRFSSWNHPRKDKGALLNQDVTRVAAFEMRRLIHEGQAGDALLICADGLALARDTALSRGLVGAMMSIGMTGRLIPACGGAIDAAGEEDRRRFMGELELIRAGFPTFLDILEVENVEMQLIAFGRFLTDGQLQRLPDNARELASDRSNAETIEGGALLQFFYWPVFVEEHRSLRDRISAGASDEELSRSNDEGTLLGRLLDGPSQSDWGKFMRRYDRVRQAHELLMSAAKVRDGGGSVAAGVKREQSGDSVVLSIPWFEEGPKSITVHPSSPEAGTP